MLFRFFLCTVLLSPIPFGTNRPWAWNLYGITLALIGLISCLSVFMGRDRLAAGLRQAWLPFCLLCAPATWAMLQTASWTPEAWAHPFWRLAAEMGIPAPGRISITPQETGTALLRLLSYLVAFALSLQFNSRSDHAALTFKYLAYAGFAYAAYGLVVFLGGYGTILWFEKWAYQEDVTATFVNRNSYATYAGLTLLAAFPLLFDRFQASLAYGIGNYYGKQYFIESILLRGWLPALMVATIASALLLSHSRGGFLSTCLAVWMLFLALSLRGKIKSPKALLALALVAAIASVSFQISGEKLLDRLDAISLEKESNERLAIYDIVLQASAENPWLGFGYGSFTNGFRLYRDDSIRHYYTEAHNTYLENIFEFGLPQALALFLAILLVALKCLRGIWRRRRDWIYPAVGFAATVLVGTHSLVDFSLQIPAVAMTYALLMGAALAQAEPSKAHQEAPCPQEGR